MSYQIDEWQNCYNDSWSGILTPAAFSHPAKYSHALIRRIYEHAIAENMIQPGGIVLDPFAGVACGAIYALMNGLNWIGCELEPRFVELGQKNIELWNAKFSSMPRWTGTAQILQGDSRHLSEIVQAAGLVVSSPPYADGGIAHNNRDYAPGKIEQAQAIGAAARRATWGYNKGSSGQDDYGNTPGNLANLATGDISAVISSPPFAGNTGGRGEASRQGIDAALFDRHSGGMKKGTGSDPANLDHLPQGNIAAVISSPPYADGCAHTGGDDPKPEMIQGGKQGAYGVAVVSSPPFADSVGSDDPDKRGGLFRDEKRRNDVNLTGSYGSTPGQLGAMKGGEITAVISSPPYEGTHVGAEDNPYIHTNGKSMGESKNAHLVKSGNYGISSGQIGTESGETFWSAARLIVEQCALLLPPGAWAIWVVKSYVKGGKLVDFPGQWQALCEACGFETVHEHRAMLVKNGGLRQSTIGGDSISKETKHASFFRLLAEKKGAPKIDWETVLCMVRK